MPVFQSIVSVGLIIFSEFQSQIGMREVGERKNRNPKALRNGKFE